MFGGCKNEEKKNRPFQRQDGFSQFREKPSCRANECLHSVTQIKRIGYPTFPWTFFRIPGQKR